MTAGHLLEVMPNNLSREYAEYYLPYLTEAMAKFEIDTKARVAYFLATLAEESGQLMYWEELADGWAYEWREDLGNIYEGDGPRYKGHGPIQITGRNNHRAVGEYLGIDAEADPTLLTQVDYGFLAAGYFVRYMSAWGNLNEYADAGDFESYTRGVNGGTTNWDSRVYYLDLAWEALPEELSIGAGGDLMFEKYNLVAAPDAPWDRAIAYAAGAALNGVGIPSLVLTAPENIRAASLAAYHGEVGQYACLVVGGVAHDHLDPIDQPFDTWGSGIDTWKCWTDDRTGAGTLRVLRNDALAYIARQEGKPDLVERFDKVLKALDPQFERALSSPPMA